MPFTPSHAVVALPFVRTPLVPAAIAIGAMTPDLPLFLSRLGVRYSFTHSVANVLWTSLIALLLFLLWRVVLRPASVELLPDPVAGRLPRSWRKVGVAAALDAAEGDRRAPRVLLLAMSLVLGVLSHIAWDAFTHEGRWGVEAIPLLAEMWGPLRGYKWLQYGSGVVGMLVIAAFGLHRLSRLPLREPSRTLPAWVRWAWMLSLPVMLIAGWLVGFAVFGPLDGDFTVQHLAYRTLPAASGLWGAMTVALSAVIVMIRPRVAAAPQHVTQP